jgi:hypothetical protein
MLQEGVRKTPVCGMILASDEANFIPGMTLPVDGGASVRRG